MELVWLLIGVALGIIAILFALGKIKTSPKPFETTRSNFDYACFMDKYETLDEVADALRVAGLESCNLLIGIDYTQSNVTQGRKTFRGRSLHHMDSIELNPYQRVIQIIGRSLSRFDEDGLIPVFGFGDVKTKDHSVFSFFEGRACRGVEEAVTRYEEITPTRTLSGPTSFAPLINKAIEIVKESGRGEYHILIIIADGQVTNERETIDAIIRASHYPLSIVMIGVGDGPWDTMEQFDDRIKGRLFDNFQFVDYHHITSAARVPDATFALHALMEVPQQFQAIKKLGLLGKKYQESSYDKFSLV